MAEEGEIQVFDSENYIIADTLFEFKLADPKTSPAVNWRSISSLDFEPNTGQIRNREDPTREIISHLDTLAETDFSNERNTRWISEEGNRALLVMQYAI